MPTTTLNTDMVSLSLTSPNADTLAAIAEVKEMKKNPAMGTSYNSVDDMLQDIVG